MTQIRRLLEAGLSTEDIGLLLPCAVGVAPDLDPCPELLATLRARFRGLDEHIGTLTRSRQTLRQLPRGHRPRMATGHSQPARHPADRSAIGVTYRFGLRSCTLGPWM